ncbi:MAG TPA: alpha-L-fucosidase [Phycisphaerae bacterium]|nr:alpha-L-fucosidase [Phycisphaerae bacterium]
MAKSKKMTAAEKDRDRRMKWWREARFGMFIHWGLYAQLGRHEWVMNRERIPVQEYEKLAATWKPKRRPARQWAALAKKAGMKYMVMTTKHHEGFCLWDTQQTDYNAARCGPGRDLVGEYVDACREFGLKIGFYYSLMDWHHPDGARCAKSEPARRRFVDFTHAAVRELMSNYGKIDILWYDVSWPLRSPELWESKKMNRMVRRLQPDILINNRSQLPEDFGTPEERIQAAEAGRDWEACMTFNGSWGYMPYAPDEDWHSSRDVLNMLLTCASGQGNLLLNIGPAPDGSVPAIARQRLLPVGRWLANYGEAVYGKADRTAGRLEFGNFGRYTLKGKTAYFLSGRWPGSEMAIGGFRTKLAKATLLPSGKRVRFTQTKDRLILRGLPKTNPDKILQLGVIKLDFKSTPKQVLGAGCVVL